MIEAAMSFLGALIGSVIGWLSSRADRHNTIRMAALEKRLAIHQETYTAWSRLLGTLYSPVLRQSTYRQFMKLWQENCLYLEASTRRELYMILGVIPTFEPSLDKQTPADKEIFKRAYALLDRIAAGVRLPPLGEIPPNETPAQSLAGSFDPMSIMQEVNSRFDEYGLPLAHSGTEQRSGGNDYR